MNFSLFPLFKESLIASLLAGNAIALLGLFILMRRISFSGLAVSQLAALGGVLAVLVGLTHSFWLALLVVLAGLLLMSQTPAKKSLPQEAWVACLYVLGAGMAVVLLSKAPHGESHTLNTFFGNVLTLGNLEIIESAFLLIATLVFLFLWLFRYIWISFDPTSAEVAGIKLKFYNVVFFGLFSVAMTLGIHIFGVLLAFTYLILPATLGLLATRGLKSLLVTIPLFTTILTLLGFHLSFQWDIPTGPFLSCLFGGMVLLLGAGRRILKGQ